MRLPEITNPDFRGLWGTERRTRWLTSVIAAGLTIMAGYLASFRAGGSLVNLSYDLPFIAHRAGETGDLRIVYLDQLDSDILNRRIQAGLLEKLREAGARAVVYDIIFDKAFDDPAVHAQFASAMRQFRGVDENGNAVPGQPRRPVMLACGRELIGQTGAMGERLIMPTNQLLDAADHFGLVLFVHDERFTVRELNAGNRDDASLAWKTAVTLGAKLDESQRLNPRWINYAGPPPDPDNPDSVPAIVTCSAKEVLKGVHPAYFKEKIVVIGGKPGILGTAAGVDLFATPFH